MNKDIVDIITEKEFIELTPQEREELKDFCKNEDEYNQLKGVFIGVASMGTEEYVPRPETKQSLDDLFYESHPKAAPVWYNSVIAVIVPRDKQVHRQPLLQVAAVALLLLLVVPFFSSNDLTAESDLVAEQNVELTEDVDDVTTETKIISKVLDEVPEEEEEDVILEVESSVAQELASPGTLASNVGMNTPLMSTRPNNHPDGIFAGIDSDALALSQPADEASELLDLLTATF